MKKSVSSFLRRFCGVALLLCLGCAAQSNDADLNHRIERQIRAKYDLPGRVNINIGPRAPSKEFPGFDTLTATISLGEQKQNYDFLISKDSMTMYRMSKIDLTKDPFAEVMNKINLDGRPVRGNKDAKVTIVNYDDFQCPYCAMMHSTIMQDILKTYGDRVKIVYKDFPLVEIHPWAKHAAIDANCLAQQSAPAYWAFADEVHARSRDALKGGSVDQQNQKINDMAVAEGQKANVNVPALQACVAAQKDDAIRASMDEATALGVEATPTIFINGQKISGAVPPEELKAFIDRALADAGQPVPATAQKPGGGF
jgi:protein-disulfide isomerase